MGDERKAEMEKFNKMQKEHKEWLETKMADLDSKIESLKIVQLQAEEDMQKAEERNAQDIEKYIAKAKACFEETQAVCAEKAKLCEDEQKRYEQIQKDYAHLFTMPDTK